MGETRIKTTVEEWLDIPGYEGFYQVSDQGRVRSLDRMVRGPLVDRFAAGRILKPAINSSNRLNLTLQLDGKKTTWLVHRLVALAFIGNCPAGMETCHNDGNQFNNALNNLRYDTRGANMLDRVKHGTHQMAMKTHCKRGHELAGGNVRMAKNANGSAYRKCIGCSRLLKQKYSATAKAGAHD